MCVGLCEYDIDCKLRAHTNLGSSDYWTSETGAGVPVLSGNPMINPDFHSWNRVFLPYCSGDVWAGQMRNRTNPFVHEQVEQGSEANILSHTMNRQKQRQVRANESNLKILEKNAKTNANTQNIIDYYFAGHLILEAIIDKLSHQHLDPDLDISMATDVLMTGQTAGRKILNLK